MFHVALTVAFLSAGGLQHQQTARSLELLGNTVRFSHIKTVQHPERKTVWGTPTTYESTLPPLFDACGVSLTVRRLESVSIRCKDDVRLDRSLALLEPIQRLKNLTFYDTPITTDKLKEVLFTVDVSALYLSSAKLPRGRLPVLNHAPLTWLCVSRTQFSNPAIADLPPALQYLDATRTRINDQGLAAFQRLRNLNTLNLCRTPTTEQAVIALRKDMPWCHIKWEPLLNP